MCIFISRQTKLKQTYNALLRCWNKHIIRCLDVESVACESLLVHGWGPHPPRVACNIFKSPQAFISSLSVAPRPLFPCSIDPPHPWIFRSIRGFPPHPRVTGSTSMCKDPWMGVIHESRWMAGTWHSSRCTQFSIAFRGCGIYKATEGRSRYRCWPSPIRKERSRGHRREKKDKIGRIKKSSFSVQQRTSTCLSSLIPTKAGSMT